MTPEELFLILSSARMNEYHCRSEFKTDARRAYARAREYLRHARNPPSWSTSAACLAYAREDRDAARRFRQEARQCDVNICMIDRVEREVRR